jgi:hypothetical protein
VLHFHGGGCLIGSAMGSLEYASRLATAADGVCYTIDYRLAPEHPYPAAIDDAVVAYRALLGKGVPAAAILLSGESAGGGLAVPLALALRTAGDALPAGILAVAPFTDLTLSGASVRAFSGDDPAANRDLLTFMGASYFQGHEPTDPLVSPLFGDLTGLPPLRHGNARRGVARRYHPVSRARGESWCRCDACASSRIPSTSTRSFLSSRNGEHDGRGCSLGAAESAAGRDAFAGRRMRLAATRCYSLLRRSIDISVLRRGNGKVAAMARAIRSTMNSWVLAKIRLPWDAGTVRRSISSASLPHSTARSPSTIGASAWASPAQRLVD